MQASEKHPPAGIEQITLVELLDRDVAPASTGRGAELFGRYRVLGLLGSGGMGAVYRVWDAVLEDEVALKMLRRELLDQPGLLTLFRQEVKLARRISHPNVVRTFDLGEHDGDYYLTMELIRGRSVRRLLAEEGQLPLDRALHIARQTAAGIAAAHAAGVLHCDLKPENLLLDDQGRVAITDFGVARAMGGGGGQVAGTPGFMAPELVELRSADARTDLYALGVALFEVVTGRSPWADPELRRDPTARLRIPAPDPRQIARVPEELANIIMRLLSPRPEGRPVAASAVQAELEEIELSVGRRQTPNPVGMVPAPATPSLAVLPFGNAGSTEDAHLAEGLTEEIIDALSATRGLRVRPLSATLGVRSLGGALAAGRALDVQAVVEGTVRRRAEEVVLAVRLIGVGDGFQLWARRFRCKDGDALVVAEEVARAIAEALAAELPGSARADRVDPVALELYLRARHVLRAGWDLGRLSRSWSRPSRATRTTRMRWPSTQWRSGVRPSSSSARARRSAQPWSACARRRTRRCGSLRSRETPGWRWPTPTSTRETRRRRRAPSRSLSAARRAPSALSRCSGASRWRSAGSRSRGSTCSPRWPSTPTASSRAWTSCASTGCSGSGRWSMSRSRASSPAPRARTSWR